MAKFAVYFDGFFNELNNYVSFSMPEITVHEHLCYKELYTSLRSKLYSFIDMNNIDIYLYLDPIKYVKKDLTITNDNDVK